MTAERILKKSKVCGVMFATALALLRPLSAIAATDEELGATQLKYEHSAGPVTTLGSYPDAKIFLDGHLLLGDQSVGNIDIVAAFPDWTNPSTVVLLLSPGGNACIGSFVVLDVQTAHLSEPFGNCGEPAMLKTVDGLVFAFRDKPWDIGWVYRNGELRKVPNLSAEDHVKTGVQAYETRDYATAIEHLWLVRQSRFPDAAYYLGLMAHLGHGIRQDYKIAMASYQQAAEIGSPPAMFRIGVLYANGRGVKKSATEAMQWYTRAAEMSDGLAQFNVGLGYLTGHGVPREIDKALFWMALSKDRITNPKLLVGVEKDISTIESKLTDAEKKSIYQKVSEWTPKVRASFGSSDIRRWVGNYPFDRIQGFTFLQTPQIRLQIAAALGIDVITQMENMATSTPIMEKDGWILARGCQPHDCPDGQWIVAINPTTFETRVCFIGLNSNIVRYGSTKATAASFPRTNRDCPAIDQALAKFDQALAPLPGSFGNNRALGGSLISIPMKVEGGTYVIPVQINGALTLDFVVDSGAADVSIPADVVLTLVRTGTLSDADFIGRQTYRLADGSTTPSTTFRIRSLKVGENVVSNVIGSVAPVQGTLLLGQSFLSRFKSWSIDNSAHALLLNK